MPFNHRPQCSEWLSVCNCAYVDVLITRPLVRFRQNEVIGLPYCLASTFCRLGFGKLHQTAATSGGVR